MMRGDMIEVSKIMRGVDRVNREQLFPWLRGQSQEGIVLGLDGLKGLFCTVRIYGRPLKQLKKLDITLRKSFIFYTLGNTNTAWTICPQFNYFSPRGVWVNLCCKPFRDTLIVAVTNSATSIFAGFVVFSAIGYMSHQYNLPVEDIATDGPGLVYVVYPEAFVTMPLAPMWASLFFFMLLCLGVDSQPVVIRASRHPLDTKSLEYLKLCLKPQFGQKMDSNL
eukprot:g43426.t1